MVQLTLPQIEAFRALALGFALAGLVASAFQFFTDQKPSFNLLNRGGWQGVAMVPLLVAAAPFIILRNTLRGRRFERRSIVFVALATMIACFWSMLCGRVALDLLAPLMTP